MGFAATWASPSGVDGREPGPPLSFLPRPVPARRERFLVCAPSPPSALPAEALEEWANFAALFLISSNSGGRSRHGSSCRGTHEPRTWSWRMKVAKASGETP
eukprot:scaffold2926_cov247-Pinguiococcus_pyrenoidosus.AAC.7